MFLSIFDVFKIGIGPSSSHTMGPMTAANRFLDELKADIWPRARSARPVAIMASLHGSLAYTGIGHGSGRAVILGLCGHNPRGIDPDALDAAIAEVEASGMVNPPGHAP
jgi:L-serine dehydratase